MNNNIHNNAAVAAAAAGSAGPVTGKTFAIPAKPPKYFDALEPHIDGVVPVQRRVHIKYAFDRIRENWPNFKEAYGKQRPKHTPEEKAQMQRQRLKKTIAKPALWEAVLDSAEVVPELRRAAALQKRALATTTSTVTNGANRRRQDLENSDQNDDDDDADDDDQVDEDNDGEVEEEKEDTSNEEEQSHQNSAECSDEQNSSDSSGRRHAGNGKRSRSPLSQAVLERAAASNATESESSPVRKKAKRMPRNTQQTLQAQLRKKVSNSQLERLKAQFYDAIAEYEIPSDEEVPKLFEKLFESVIQVNGALDQVGHIFDDIMQ